MVFRHTMPSMGPTTQLRSRPRRRAISIVYTEETDAMAVKFQMFGNNRVSVMVFQNGRESADTRAWRLTW